MPKVLAHTPDWLCRGRPGFDLFELNQANTAQKYEGPQKTIAYRGTEIIVAVGKELRWADLNLLRSHDEGEQGLDIGKGYKTLKNPAYGEVTKLVVSPDGNYLAVLTAHLCYVCVLPAPSHLRVEGHKANEEIRMKTFQVGPTAHVVEQAPLATALWHPLSRPDTPSLVTITKDACVRLWEIDIDNRNSFNEPALAVDLKKLGNATSTAADFSASKYGTKTDFSPDAFEMEVAAASFGGSGLADEDGWASLTLWLVMAEGDVYALCPFLPSQFRVPASMLPGLSTSVVAKSRMLVHDFQASESEKRTADAQTKWLADLDEQEPLILRGQTDFDAIEIYNRPERPGAIPKLQGPFQVSPEPDFGEITDIHVIAPVIDQTELYDDEFDEAPENEGLSLSVVCLATSTGKVNICLDLNGVEADWLPTKRSRAYTFDEEDDKDLLLFETVDLATGSENAEQNALWSTFTSSSVDRYQLFVTNPSGVYGLDLKPWIHDLENELANPSEAGGGFRANLLLDSASTFVDHPINLSHSTSDGSSPVAAVSLLEPSLGHFLLTSFSTGPYAASLDLPRMPFHPWEPEILALPEPEPREPYQPPAAFFAQSQLPNFLGPRRNDLARSQLREPLRFNQENLHTMTETHRIISHETNRLGLAAADLFRRCERLRSELHDQVSKVRDLADRVDRVTGDDDRDEVAALGASVDGEIMENARLFGNDKAEHRVMAAQSKTKELSERAERLRRKMQKLGTNEMSSKEAAFAREVERLRESLAEGKSGAALTSPSASQEQEQQSAGSLMARFEEIDDMQEQLAQQAAEAVQRLAEQDSKDGKQSWGGSVGKEFRRQKMEQVLALLDRETALVDGVTERLRRLGALQ